MKRDMNLVREILLAVENIPANETLYSEDISLEDCDRDTINYHCKLMIEHGMLEGQLMNELSGVIPPSYIVTLTWEGHDFLDACRDEKRWQKAQGLFKAVGTVSFDVIKNTLSTLAINAITTFLNGEINV